MDRCPVACASGLYGGHVKPEPTPGRRRRRETFPVACASGLYGGHAKPEPTTLPGRVAVVVAVVIMVMVVACGLRLVGQRHAEQVAVGLEAIAVHVHEDRIGHCDRLLLSMVGAHHLTECRRLTDRGHHEVGVRLKPDRDRVLKPDDLAGKSSPCSRRVKLRAGSGRPLTNT